MVEYLLESSIVYRPWPVIYRDRVFNGQKFGIPSCCSEECYRVTSNDKKCIHGFSYFARELAGESVVVGGVFEKIDFIPRSYRHIAKGRGYSNQDIEKWRGGLSRLLGYMQKQKEITFSESMRPLHEISKWANQVYAISQRLINGDSSQSFEKNFDAASQDKKAILKSAQMLVDSFDTLTIYFNPASAAYGRKRSTDVYRLIHKIAIILDHAEAAANNKKIKLFGESRKKYDIYESFKVIPLCLLQNAIKYSTAKDIEVSFEEAQYNLTVCFTSIGPVINVEEQELIFERGFRGVWASKLHHEGMGMGLFTSQIAAKANQVKISVSCCDLAYEVSGIPQGRTTFTLKIPN